MMEVLRKNPFAVLSPDDAGLDREEEITNAEIIHKLFVDVFEDFTQIPQQGHVFLNGPRGCGKSMMFRFLLPDCQMIDKAAKKYSELDFFSIHIPIKLTSINYPEYELIKDFGNTIFNEHILTLYFAELIFDAFAGLNYALVEDQVSLNEEIKSFYERYFVKRLRLCGWNPTDMPLYQAACPKDGFLLMKDICSDLFVEAVQFLKRNVQNMRTPAEFVPYTGALCDYLTFLFPLLKQAKKLSLFPDRPFFLLVDDADNLNKTQVTVLNTWVSYRTTSEVCLKISTQLRYPTYNTVSGINIDSPHDYYDINVLTVYSSSKDVYNKRIKQIVQKRLEYFFERSDVKPEEYFPLDTHQQAEIDKVKERIRANHATEGRGYRASDDVTRYAVSEYIKSLKGTSKSGSTYKYAGFDQLVSISSGVIRHFLTPAAKMFSTELRNIKLAKPDAVGTDVLLIPPSVQDRVIRDYSTSILIDEYDNKLKKNEKQIESDPTYLSKVEKLRNLIDALGGLFHEYLLSNRSERKVFSFAVSGNLDSDIEQVIELGVEHGYFHKSTIGKKNGLGKTRLYILNRILAPHFLLDPVGYAHYQFFTSEKLRLALQKPDLFAEQMMKVKTDDEEQTKQLALEFADPIEN